MDAWAVAGELWSTLREVDLEWHVEVARGSRADAIAIAARYGDPVKLVDDEGRLRLIRQDGDGRVVAVDTELSAGGPTDVIALYLVFQILWAIRRAVSENSARTQLSANLLADQQSALAFIAARAANAENPVVRSYATALMRALRAQ